MESTIGPGGQPARAASPESCRQIKLTYPILDNEQLAKLRHVDRAGVPVDRRCRCCSTRSRGRRGARARRWTSCASAGERGGRRRATTILILSDRGVDRDARADPEPARDGRRAPPPRARGQRARAAASSSRSGDAREVHHVRAAARLRRRRGQPVPRVRDARRHDPPGPARRASTHETAVKNYIKALNKGILKVMSKMGISTLQSYCGAQIFEAVGLDQAFVDRYFTGTASRIGGIGLDVDRRGGAPPPRARVPGRGRSAAASSTGAASTSGAATASTTCSTRRRSSSCSTPRAAASTRSSRSTRGSSTTRAATAPRCAACSSFKPAGAAGPARRGRAGRVDPQALRDRRDVLRLDQPGGARDARHRDEPHRRQVEHRRGRRGSGALRAATPTATGGAARSSRSRPAASA